MRSGRDEKPGKPLEIGRESKEQGKEDDKKDRDEVVLIYAREVSPGEEECWLSR